MGIDGWKTEDRNLYMCGVLSSGPVFTPVLQILPEGRKILDITFGPSCTTIILFDPTSSRNVPIFFLKHFFSLFLIFVLVFLFFFVFFSLSMRFRKSLWSSKRKYGPGVLL